jgi:hypothetical protein
MVFIKFKRIHTVPMVSCPRDPSSSITSSCTEPYDSSMCASAHVYIDVRATSSWERATVASRRREHGPFFSKVSAGVLRRSHGVKEKKDRSDGAAHPRSVIEHIPLKCCFLNKLCPRSGEERGHRLSSGRIFTLS